MTIYARRTTSKIFYSIDPDFVSTTDNGLSSHGVMSSSQFIAGVVSILLIFRRPETFLIMR